MGQKIEQSTVMLIAFLGIFIPIAHFLGLLESIPWFSDHIPSFSLLMLGTITILLLLEKRTTFYRLNETLSILNAYFNVLKEKDHFAELTLIYALREYGKSVSENTVRVEGSHVLDFWRDCIGGCKRWSAIAYAKDETWESGWGNNVSQGIQQERILAGATIKRVFVVEDIAESERLNELMRAQQDIGIDVRWITKADLLRSAKVVENFKILGTRDIAVADDSWVSRLYLNKKRNITHADAVKNSILKDKALFNFNQAFAQGKLP